MGCKDTTGLGWYVTAVQNLGDHFAVAARYDQFDPSRDVPAGCEGTVVRAADQDRLDAISVALLWYLSGNLRATLAYDHFGEQDAAQKDNDALTVQLQAKF
jgi:hypothetical protein